MIEKFKSLGKDTIIYGTGNFAISAIGILLVPIYTRVFSPSEYGVMGILATVTNIMLLFVDTGISTAQTYYFFDTEDKSSRRVIISTSLGYQTFSSLVICSMLFVFARPFSKSILGNPDYAIYLIITALTVPFIIISTLFRNILRMTFSKWKYSFLSIGSAIFTTVLSIYFVVIAKKGLVSVFQARLYSGILFCIIGFPFVRDYLRLSFSPHIFKDMLKYGLPLVPGGVSIWIINSVDKYFLVHYASMSDVGLYTVGSKFALLITFVTMAFRIAWSPFGFSIAKQDDARDFYAKVLTYYLTGLLLLCVFCSLFAREMLMILTQPAYYDGSKVVGLLGFSAVGYGVIPITSIGLALAKKNKFSSLAIGVAAVANVIMDYMLVPIFSIIGASLATAISFLIANIVIYIANQKYYHIPFESKKILKGIIFSVIFVFIGLLLDRNYTPYFIFVKIFLYLAFVGLFFITSVIEKKEISALVVLIKKKAQ